MTLSKMLNEMTELKQSPSHACIPEHISLNTWELYCCDICDLILPRGIILQNTLGMR